MDNDQKLKNIISAGIERSRIDLGSISSLLQAGARVDLRLGGESLACALAECDAPGSAAAIAMLAEFGADLGWRDEFGAGLVARAARVGNILCMEALARLGAPTSAKGADGRDALQEAVDRLDCSVASALMRLGVSASKAKDPDGRPILSQVAGRLDGCSMALELLHGGADPCEQDSQGWSPLALAARAGAASMAEILLDRMADPGELGPGGLAPLAIALGARPGRQILGGSKVGPGHIFCAVAIAKRLPPTWGWRPDANGRPPLARLCFSIGRFELAWMEALRRAGADPRAESVGGGGLLSVAGAPGLSNECSLALAAWALGAGADPGRRCCSGMLPEDRAMAAKKFEVARLLCSAREAKELESVERGAQGGSKRL